MPYKTVKERNEYGYQYYREHRDEILARKRRYYRQHTEGKHEYNQKRMCGTIERYDEAMLKYDGECAFACDRKAFLVHHMDGKSMWNSPTQQVNNDLTNLLPLCNSCHTWVHKKGRNLHWGEGAVLALSGNL